MHAWAYDKLKIDHGIYTILTPQIKGNHRDIYHLSHREYLDIAIS